jgi:plasmid maintenance system killer protein
MVRVGFETSFIRTYKKLPRSLQIEILKKIELFKIDYASPQLKVHNLKGPLKRFYSFSVNFNYRIIFKWVGSRKDEVTLLKVGTHEIYK